MSKQVYTLVDFQNAVEQIATPETEKCPLLPLFEAIHNSIQSIKQAKICNGYVNVKITRDPDDIPAKCISEISIEDNGVGFTEENLLSFGRLFSTYKKNEFNCKGIGRLSYFAVFNDIVIDSEFEKNGKFYKILRRINKNNFYKISKIKLCETNMKFANRTFITLKNVNPNFKNKLKIPEDAVQNQITQHFIPSLLSIKNFKITVLDESGSYDVDHNASDVSQGNSININSNIFDLYFLKNRSSVRSKHKIILSADGRTVKEEKIEFLPTSKIGLDDDKFYLNAVVISDFLDSKLNSQRTDFRIPTKKELGNNEISLDEIYEKVFEESRRFASESITHLENVLNDFIEKTCEELPHLSFLKNDKKIRENFKLGVDAETVKNTYVHQFAVKQVESFNYVRAISKKYESKDIPNFDDFKKEAIEKLEDGMKINHAPLITYITYRDFVLSLYEKLLEKKENGKYQPEKILHDMLFPTKNQSVNSTADYFTHNLWIIDDRYAVYNYAASDVYEYKVMDGNYEKNSKRYDICAAYSDPLGEEHNIFIVELKKTSLPLSDANDPVKQIMFYVQKMINGEIQKYNGTRLNITQYTQFHGLVLCDVHNKYFKDVMKSFYSLKQRPDSKSYHAVLLNDRFFLEVTNYQNLLDIARSRNKVFIDKLKL